MNFRTFIKKFLFLFGASLLVASSSYADKIKLVTTTTDLAWAAKRIGGSYVSVQSMLKGHEDPHYVDAVPSFVLKASRADIVCSVGLELESAWLPKVLERSGNAKVQAGGTGYCNTGSAITPLDVPKGKIDRSQGHVHAAGNPHFWLDPKTFAHASKAIADAIVRTKPELAEPIASQYSKFLKDMLELQDQIRAKVSGLGSTLKVMEYHEEFSYYFRAIGLTSYGSLEEKPGVPPSSGRIARMALKAKKEEIKIILASSHSPKRLVESFTSKTHSTLPVYADLSVQPEFGKEDYNKMILNLTDNLVKTAKKTYKK